MIKRFSISLKLYKNGKMVLDDHFQVRKRVLRLAQRELWDNGYIKVSYGHGYYNHADFSNINHLRALVSAFTEKALVDGFCLSE